MFESKLCLISIDRQSSSSKSEVGYTQTGMSQEVFKDSRKLRPALQAAGSAELRITPWVKLHFLPCWGKHSGNANKGRGLVQVKERGRQVWLATSTELCWTLWRKSVDQRGFVK